MGTYLADLLLVLQENIITFQVGNTEENPLSGEDSFQVLAPDLNVTADVGTSVSGDTSHIGPIMGNLIGDSLTALHNIMFGVAGKWSVTGVKATIYPTGALLGIIGDGVTEVDGIVTAAIDGDDPSSVTRAGAAFKVRMTNNNAGSGTDYGLDLFDDGSAVNAQYSGTAQPYRVANADLRLTNNVVVMSGAGAPVDGTTGDNFAGPGSLYIDRTNFDLYIQGSAITTPVWKLVTRAA